MTSRNRVRASCTRLAPHHESGEHSQMGTARLAVMLVAGFVGIAYLAVGLMRLVNGIQLDPVEQ